MELIADGLLILAALVASLYCLVLSRRLRRLNQLDHGLGGAISALSSQVDDMRAALESAKSVTEQSKRELEERTKAAQEAGARLDLLLASLSRERELAEKAPAPAAPPPPLAEVAPPRPEKVLPAEKPEEAADEEMRLADLVEQARNGEGEPISTDLLKALDKIAGGQK